MINKKTLDEMKSLNNAIIKNACTQSVIFDNQSIIDLNEMPEIFGYTHNIYKFSIKQKKLLDEINED